jgi:hypothetical protein
LLLESRQFFSKIVCVSSMFTGLFIDSRRILETLKIVGFESLCNKELQNPKIKNFQNRAAADLGFTRRCDRSHSGCDRSHGDRSPLFRTNIGAFDLFLGARTLVRSIAQFLRSNVLTDSISFDLLPSFSKFLVH